MKVLGGHVMCGQVVNEDNSIECVCRRGGRSKEYFVCLFCFKMAGLG